MITLPALTAFAVLTFAAGYALGSWLDHLEMRDE